MAELDDWQTVGADDWQPVGGPTAPPVSELTGGPGFIDAVKDHVAPVLNAFGQGFSEGWGPDRWGMSKENQKWLSSVGIYAPTGSERYTNPFHAFNELLIETLARTAEMGTRGLPAIYHGLQGAGVEAGLPRDIVSIPDAFMGSPHPTGIPGEAVARAAREGTVRELGQRGNIEVRPTPPEMRASEASPPPPASAKGQSAVGAYGDIFLQGDRAIIEGAPRESYVRDISRGNIDPPTTEQLGSVITAANDADRKYSISLGMSEADYDRLAKLNKTIDNGSWAVYEKASREKEEILARLPPEQHTLDVADAGELHQLRREFEALEQSPWENLSAYEDGIARVLKRYVADFTRGDDFARAVFKKAFVEAEAHGFDTRKLGNDVIDRYLSDLSESDRAFMREEFARFTQKRLPVPEGPPPIVEARQLGVIGPERPEPTFNDSPSELAQKTLPSPQDLSAARSPEEARKILGHEPGEYDERGKAWISKIDEPNDVRDVIGKIASENDFFPEARGGIASSAAREAVAEAAGIGPADLDASQFSTHFDSDGKVRAVIQVLRQTAKDYMGASKAALDNPTPENLAASVEAEMRHAHVVEYTMGLRAESGRTLAAWKDLLRETEQTRAKVALRSEEQAGKTPKGTADIVDAVGEVRENLKNPDKKPGLQKLVDAAKNLVDNADKPVEPGEPKAPLSPEVQDLVKEAKNVLKSLGLEKDVELEAFHESLKRLSEGKGALGETVDAARDLVNRDKPEADAKPKVVSAKAQLKAAAKRLVAAADGAQAKAARSSPVQNLMETTRQAVGLLKKMNLSNEMRDFKAALESKDASAAADAARKLIEAEGKTKAPASERAPLEYDQIMAAARRVANATEIKVAREKAEAMPDVQAALDQSRDAVKELQGERKSALDKLIDAAEQNAVNMTKQKAVKEPVEALPPELQALVDKTKRVVDRFGGIARGERSALLMARTGRTFAEQEQIVRSFSGLSPNQVAKVLDRLRTAPAAERPGWFYWMWQQGLISGLITHTKYLAVNTATTFLERVISPFFGAVLDRARGQNTSIAGPLYANIAMVHALPDAFSAAGQAFKTGMRVPLESELNLFRRGEESPQTKGAGAAYMQSQSPEWGIWNRVFNETQLDSAAKVLGIPGKSANMIHTFYKVLSERASASTQAFQAAHEEGKRGDAFWQRYRYHLDNPTDDALRGAVNDAYSGAFMAKLGPKLTTFTHALSKNPITKWLFPFQHIPWNIERMSVEYSPFAVLGPEMRASLLGQKGVPAQNLAIAKMAVGSSVLGYFMHKALSGTATGDYPQDEKERHKWQALDIRPNSIQMGGQWVSYERLGPAGNVAHMGASIGSIIKQYDSQDDAALTKAIWASAVAAANQVGNEVGFQSLKNLIEAIENEKKAERFIAWQGGSLMPMSSFVSQNASIIDPYQRKANTLVDGLKYRVPFLRETLLPKRDFFGEPLPNPSYHTITPMGQVNIDPVKAELARLEISPLPPTDRIGGVKLTPKLYDEYQVLAGAMAKTALEPLVNSPGWTQLPPNVRIDTIHANIRMSHQTAEAVMQARHPEIIMSGIQQRIDYITGKSLTPRPKKAPEALH